MKLIEENKELKKEKEENIVLIQKLTEQIKLLKQYEARVNIIENDLGEKKQQYQEIRKKFQELEDIDFCKYQELIQKYSLLEKQNTSLKEEVSQINKKYYQSLMKIDSQKDIIKELKKVLLYNY